MILPLLKTFDVLLAHNFFDSISAEDQRLQFFSSLLAATKTEVYTSKDVKKLLSGVSVVIHLLQGPEETRSDALSFLMAMLGHKYPRVRKWTAEQVYVKMLEEVVPVPEADYDLLLDKLMGVVWDSSDVDMIRSERDECCKLLGLKPPERVKAGTSRARGPLKENRRDDLESYAALVKDVGY